VNVESFAAVAVSVTRVPLLKLALHAVPQSIPAGALATTPDPVPVFVTVSANVLRAKEAVTVRVSLIVTTHDPVPVHAPLQPVNVESFAAAAVSVTLAPFK
jgi:hypothetical protein